MKPEECREADDPDPSYPFEVCAGERGKGICYGDSGKRVKDKRVKVEIFIAPDNWNNFLDRRSTLPFRG